MAWDHLSITRPHLVYIILGGFTSLFMLCSSVIKERMYIGEATVATICGLIFGPHAANLINPQSWGNVDEVTIEFSRIVLVVQCFAVGVELPKYYMEKHWKSVTLLLVPVMTFGWLITSLFIWWMIPPLNWLESLCVAACVTATDPVLASSVVGKGKFAKRVPKHLRDLLSAESGCNDGMAFPFIYLALYLIQDNRNAKEVTFHWIVFTILYECIFGAFYGFMVGYIARHGIKYAEQHELIDRESFLVFYFVLALFCAGSGSILGVDDLLVGFSCGVGFSNDGWFASKTEESHVSNVIDLLLNLAYFVFLGTIIPWEQYNNAALGLSAWRLTIIALFVILFRRIPIMMVLKPIIPDVKSWREALFAGHFGPIGVGAIFVAILARAELESDNPIPLTDLPPADHPHYTLLALVWPIVTFLVISSIIVHGSSVAVFTLGRRINTLSLTLSYTKAPDEGPSWMARLPRISSQSRSQALTGSSTDLEELKQPDFPPGTLPPTGWPGQFLRRQREESSSRAGSRASSLVSRRRRKNGVGAGGPVSQSAIFPQHNRDDVVEPMSPTDSESRFRTEREDTGQTLAEDEVSDHERYEEKISDEEVSPPPHHGVEAKGDTRTGQVPQVEVYDEGDHIVIEDEEGQVLAVEPSAEEHHAMPDVGKLKEKAKNEVKKPGWTYDSLKKRLGEWREEESQKRKAKTNAERKHEPARAYQFGNTIIVEDEDGEVVKKYELPPQKPSGGSDLVGQGLKYMGMGGLVKQGQKEKVPTEPGESGEDGPSEAGPSKPTKRSTFRLRSGTGEPSRKDPDGSKSESIEEDDDRQIRFTIGGEGQRMTKTDFLNRIQKLDAQTRRQVLEQSDAPPAIIKAASMQHPESGFPEPDNASVPESQTVTTTTGRSGPLHTSSHPVDAPSTETPETAIERRRRLAALSGIQSEEEADEYETPAERRRREAALGMGDAQEEDSDSEDDDTPRVPPARRGIRFADAPTKDRS